MKTAGAKLTTTGPWKTARSIDWLTGCFINDSDEFDRFGGFFLLLLYLIIYFLNFFCWLLGFVFLLACVSNPYG